MISNNITGLIGHIITSIIMFIFIFVVNLNPALVEILYGNIVLKVLLCLLPCIMYYAFGKLMSKKQNLVWDFFAGLLIVLITALLLSVVYMGVGNELYTEGVSSSLWRLPLDLFTLPQIFAITLLNVDYNIYSIMISSLIPSIIYGISIKVSKKKYEKRKIARERNIK